MRRQLLLLPVLLLAAACGPGALRFETERSPVSGTITLVEQGNAPTSEGGVVFVDAMVVDAPPITGAKLVFRYRHGRVGVLDVDLGTFFPEGGQETVPARPTGLLEWCARQLSPAESLLEIDLDQDPVAGAQIVGPGLKCRFCGYFICNLTRHRGL